MDKSGANVKENYRKTTEVVRPCEENERGAHSEKNFGCGHTREKKRPNLRCIDAYKRDMTQAGLKEENATNRAIWRKKLISYIPATPDDGTSQG